MANLLVQPFIPHTQVDDVMTTSCPSLHEPATEELEILPNVLDPSFSVHGRVHPTVAALQLGSSLLQQEKEIM